MPSSRPSTAPRSPPTPRASMRSPPPPSSSTGTSTWVPWPASGEAAASSAPASWTTSPVLTPRTPLWPVCSRRRSSPRPWPRCYLPGARSWPPPPPPVFRPRPSPPPWPTSTSCAHRACLQPSSRGSATSSDRTPTTAPTTSRASTTRCGPRPSAPRRSGAEAERSVALPVCH